MALDNLSIIYDVLHLSTSVAATTTNYTAPALDSEKRQRVGNRLSTTS